MIMALTGLLVGWRIQASVLDAAAGFVLLLLFAYALLVGDGLRRLCWCPASR